MLITRLDCTCISLRLQVQDVGLIFMSAMTTSIAALCVGSDRMALGTALTWLAISTMLVGVAIVGVGKRKLATLVQYMPVGFHASTQLPAAWLPAIFTSKVGMNMLVGFMRSTKMERLHCLHTRACCLFQKR